MIKNSDLSGTDIVIETNGSLDGNRGIFWRWTATEGNRIVASDNDNSYELNATSQVAQFLAVNKALEWTAKNLPTKPVKIVTHLDLIPDALNGKKSIRKPHLLPIYNNMKRLLAKTNADVVWERKSKIRNWH